MKMSDVFKGIVSIEADPLSEHAAFAIFDNKGAVLSAWNGRYAEAAAHAINQHDQLTAINKELVEALEASLNYATSLPMEITSPQPQIEAWKSLSALEPFELIKRAKELTNEG